MLKASIEDLARRFATTNGGMPGRQRLRERTDDFVLDLIAVLREAPLSEIAETTRVLERKRKARVTTRSTSRGASRSRKGASAIEESDEDSAPERPAPAPSRNPFEITVPNDLLEPSVSPAPAAHLRATTRTSKRKPSPMLEAAAEAPAPPPPAQTVSLRAGEELLRTGGSGAIIRRVRGG
jgi:hypothetical protein